MISNTHEHQPGDIFCKLCDAQQSANKPKSKPARLDMTVDRAFLLNNAPAVLAVLRTAWAWQQDRATWSEDLRSSVRQAWECSEAVRLASQVELESAIADLGEPPS